MISGLKGFATKYIIKGIPKILPGKYLNEITPNLKYFLKNNVNIKVRFILKCKMGIDDKGTPKFDKAYFHSKTYINFEDKNIKIILIGMKETILNAISNYQAKGSRWYFDNFLKLEINTVKYHPMKGSSSF